MLSDRTVWSKELLEWEIACERLRLLLARQAPAIPPLLEPTVESVGAAFALIERRQSNLKTVLLGTA